MDPLSIGTLAGSLLGGIFGGHARRNPFQKQINAQTNTLEGLQGTYGQNAANATANYNRYAPKSFAAIDNYGDYLQRDPYTDSYSARALAKATAGTNTAYNSAQSNLAANMARRGITGSSGDLGGMADIETARAAQFAAAQNSLANLKIQTHADNLQKLMNLYTGVAGSERSVANQALASQAGVTQQLLGAYSGMNSAANQQAAADDARTQGLWTSAGRLLGGVLGGRSQPAPTGGGDEEQDSDTIDPDSPAGQQYVYEQQIASRHPDWTYQQVKDYAAQNP